MQSMSSFGDQGTMPTRYLSKNADDMLKRVCDILQKEHGAPVSRSGAIEAMFFEWNKPGGYGWTKRATRIEANNEQGKII